MSNNVSKMVLKSGGPKMSQNGQKWPPKMGNLDFSVLHHRTTMKLLFAKCFVEIESTGENILAGQK